MLSVSPRHLHPIQNQVHCFAVQTSSTIVSLVSENAVTTHTLTLDTVFFCSQPPSPGISQRPRPTHFTLRVIPNSFSPVLPHGCRQSSLSSSPSLQPCSLQIPTIPGVFYLKLKSDTSFSCLNLFFSCSLSPRCSPSPQHDVCGPRNLSF